MNVVKEIERINQKELENGIYGGCGKGSWHDKYKNSAWVYVGGLSYELSEGDIICVMSQWGEIEDINLVREQGTNTSKGFCFLKYEDQRSTILAVDNFNGVKLLGRVLRVDHVDKYKLPKEIREKEEERLDEDPEALVKIGPGHAYSDKELANEFSVTKGHDLWAPPPSNSGSSGHGNGNGNGGGMSSAYEQATSSSDKNKKKKHHSKDSKKKKTHKDHKEHKEKKEHKKRKLEAYNSSDGGRRRHEREDRRDSERGNDDVSGQILPPSNLKLPPDLAEAPAASWRGSRDPALAVAAQDYARRLKRAEKEGGDANSMSAANNRRRDEFSGFGGMNRRR